MTDAVEEALAVQSCDQLVAYLIDLADRARAGKTPVENELSMDMIEAAGSWARGMENFLRVRDIDLSQLSPWAVSALLFSAGLVYE